jgi:hypothetical protein
VRLYGGGLASVVAEYKEFWVDSSAKILENG